MTSFFDTNPVSAAQYATPHMALPFPLPAPPPASSLTTTTTTKTVNIASTTSVGPSSAAGVTTPLVANTKTSPQVRTTRDAIAYGSPVVLQESLIQQTLKKAAEGLTAEELSRPEVRRLFENLARPGPPSASAQS